MQEEGYTDIFEGQSLSQHLWEEHQLVVVYPDYIILLDKFHYLRCE